MERFNIFLRKSLGWGTYLGAIFLIGMAVLIVANVVDRIFGHVIGGTYELSTIIIVVPVAFALGYAALSKRHVVVNIIVSKFHPRVQAYIKILVSFISLGVWTSVLWANVLIMNERWLNEGTPLLQFPYLPVRFIWVIGLGLFCLVYLSDMIQAVREAVKK